MHLLAEKLVSLCVRNQPRKQHDGAAWPTEGVGVGLRAFRIFVLGFRFLGFSLAEGTRAQVLGSVTLFENVARSSAGDQLLPGSHVTRYRRSCFRVLASSVPSRLKPTADVSNSHETLYKPETPRTEKCYT